MSWRGEFSELLQFLDESTATYPIRLFSTTPEKDSTPVRRVAFALENIVEQLKKPLVPSTQALAQALVYKFNGPHRRQGYWMNYKNLSRALRKYNEDDLLKKVSDVHKKATASGAGFYMPSNDVIRYIGGAYLKRLFRLQQIRDLCVRTAHVIMGQLELGHWEKFSLFIVAMCADISNGISKQASAMESAYAGLSSFLTSLDKRFPSSLADLSISSDLRGRVMGQKTVDTARVMRLLQLTDEQLDAVRTKDQMARFREEILSSMDSSDTKIDLGTTVERDVEETSQTDDSSSDLRKVSIDSGLEIESEASTSLVNTVFEDPVEEDMVEKEELPIENGKKRGKKLRKRKKKSKPLSHPLDIIPSSSLFEDTDVPCNEDSLNECPSNKKEKKRQRKGESKINGTDSLLSSPSASPSILSLSNTLQASKTKKKKRKSGNVLPTNFDLSFESVDSTRIHPDESLFITPKKKLKKKQSLNGNIECDIPSRKRKSTDSIMALSPQVVSAKKKKKQHL
ncbi:hypothetical protein Y032_0009g442 [Ancylostoma ceylanicum]|uniref:Nucleolus and neural progenitor protein-like N-terminal domain-containing protein n=1 Tax=Ancylostoma ceylanicum TaxID=53326 RepID=A0A016VIU5_9BILA|nr:hypothetical protein Y032_0009g442 [Ancylostoma ceylanicum]